MHSIWFYWALRLWQIKQTPKRQTGRETFSQEKKFASLDNSLWKHQRGGDMLCDSNDAFILL